VRPVPASPQATAPTSSVLVECRHALPRSPAESAMPNTRHDHQRNFRVAAHGSGPGKPSVNGSEASPDRIRTVGQRPTGVLRHTHPIVAATAILLAVFFSACGSATPTLNTVAVEHAVAESILTQHHLHAHVACPSNVQQKAGLVFTCAAKLDVGTYSVLVTETDGAGKVRYQNAAPLIILNIAKVERSIERSIHRQRALHATVTCPPEVIQKAGIVFTCIATVNGRRYPFTATEVDSEGHVRYIGH
jgi:hypothetical protein